jgi:putative tryptophan/tyrosine transport system substrate-binding protein
MTMWFVTVALIVSLVLGILAAVPMADAQQLGKVHRVGNVGTGFPGPHQQPLTEAFRQGLRDVGWVDGQNVAIESRLAEGREEWLPELVAALIGLKVDVIFARGTRALAAAKHATNTIPIVALDLESDPVAMGFIASLARPGGNITGVFLDLPELSGKQLELLTEVVPALSRMAVLGDPAINGAQFRATEVAAQALGVQLQALEVRDPSEFDSAFQVATSGGSRALLVLQSPLVFRNRTRIVELAAKHGLPALAFFREFAEAGGLMAYGSNQRDLFRRCGVYVGKILQGAKPETLPVERPMKFDLIINRKTAQALGITFPQTLLVLADEVIQ